MTDKHISVWAWASTTTTDGDTTPISTTEKEILSVFRKFPMSSIKTMGSIECLEEHRRDIEINMVGLDSNFDQITWKVNTPRIIIQHGDELPEADIKRLDIGLHMTMRSMVEGYKSETPMFRLLKIKEQLSSSGECPKGYHSFVHWIPNGIQQPSHDIDILRHPGHPGGTWDGFVADANKLNPPISRSWRGDYRIPGGYILAAVVNWDTMGVDRELQEID